MGFMFWNVSLLYGWAGGLVAKSCSTLVIPCTVCSLPGSSVHGILQARILAWVAIPSPGLYFMRIINSEKRLILRRDSNKRSVGIRDKLWILPMSAGDFAHMEGGCWFNRNHRTELMTEPGNGLKTRQLHLKQPEIKIRPKCQMNTCMQNRP